MFYSKTAAVLLSAGLMITVLAPVAENLRATPEDTFPLSYYPMFSFKRDSLYSVYHFVGRDSENESINIPYKMVGTGGFNQVRRQVNKMVKEEKEVELIQKVAKKLERTRVEPYSLIEEVSLVKGTYHLEKYFSTDKQQPVRLKVIASQNIERL